MATLRTGGAGVLDPAGGRVELRLLATGAGAGVAAGTVVPRCAPIQNERPLEATIEDGPVGASSASNVSPLPTQAAKVAVVITRGL